MDAADADAGTPAKRRLPFGMPGAAILVGILALLYGSNLAGSTAARWAELQPPGTTLGPPALIQLMGLQIDEGVYLMLFGVVLIGGGVTVGVLRRSTKELGSLASLTRVTPLAAAMALVLASWAITAVPTPERTLEFSTSDFQLQALPGHAPYENYFVSLPFQAYAGEYLDPLFNFSLTDNRTGAIEHTDFPATVWYTSPSQTLDWRNRSQEGSGAVVPKDGMYVLWIQYTFCETPATWPCSNYTGSVQGTLFVHNQVANVSWVLGLGVSGSAAMGAAVVQSGLGRRRTIS